MGRFLCRCVWKKGYGWCSKIFLMDCFQCWHRNAKFFCFFHENFVDALIKCHSNFFFESAWESRDLLMGVWVDVKVFSSASSFRFLIIDQLWDFLLDKGIISSKKILNWFVFVSQAIFLTFKRHIVIRCWKMVDLRLFVIVGNRFLTTMITMLL